MLLSRKTDKNGIDRTQQVTLNLPFKSAAKITMHYLTGAPRSNNMAPPKMNDEEIVNSFKTMHIKRASKDIATTELQAGTMEIVLPPACFRIYTFEGVR